MVFVKVKKCCCLPLSSGCVIFGILDLVSQIYVLVVSSQELQQSKDTLTISKILMSSVALLTILCMITGTVKQKRFLMLPHIILEAFFTIIVIVLLFKISYAALVDGVLVAISILFMSCLISALYIYYWSVMYSRFHEIRESQEDVPNEVEME